MTLIALFVVPCLVSAALTALLIRWAPRLGLIDQPGERKVHTQPTPRGGGLAIYFAMLLTVGGLAFRDPRVQPALVFLLTGGVIVLLGLLDDWLSLPWQVRLAVQTGAAVLALGWPQTGDLLPWPFALIWVVGLVNAFNMLDNMDALSAGTAWIAAFMLFLAGLVLWPEALNWIYLVFLGAVAGFLCFNRSPARIFMGDAGSTFLGFFLGVRTLHDGFGNPAMPMTGWVPLAVLAVPWYDLITVVALRLSQGRSPFHADKQHLSHRLVERGLTSRGAVCTIHGLGLASGLGGLLLVLMPEWSGVIGTGLVLFWSIIALLDWRGRRS